MHAHTQTQADKQTVMTMHLSKACARQTRSSDEAEVVGQVPLFKNNPASSTTKLLSYPLPTPDSLLPTPDSPHLTLSSCSKMRCLRPQNRPESYFVERNLTLNESTPPPHPPYLWLFFAVVARCAAHHHKHRLWLCFKAFVVLIHCYDTQVVQQRPEMHIHKKVPSHYLD